MSAFIVCDEHISAMLRAAALSNLPGDGLAYRWNDESHYFNGSAHVVGQKLLDENYRSVNYRYGESDAPRIYTHPTVSHKTAVQIIKAIHCYRYQACETPDWEQSEAFAICEALEARAVHCLPGYDEAEWEITH